MAAATATRAPALRRALVRNTPGPRSIRSCFDQVLADVPDELIADVAREAAGKLYLRDLRP